MASVHAPSYIPPLTFEPFVLSETHERPTSSGSIPRTAGDFAGAYPSLAKIRGPRHRGSHVTSYQAPATVSDVHSPAVAQRPALRKSTTVPNTKDPLSSHSYSATGPNHSLARSVTSATYRSVHLPSRDVVPDDFLLSNSAGRSKRDRRKEVVIQKHVSSEAADDDMVTNTHTIAVNGFRPNPTTVHYEGTRTRNNHLLIDSRTTTAPDDILIAEPADPSMLLPEDDGRALADRASVISSRPTSELPGDTIDQLESLAKELRAMTPVTGSEVQRPRVRRPLHGPRPCTPQSGSTTPRSLPTTPRAQFTFANHNSPPNRVANTAEGSSETVTDSETMMGSEIATDISEGERWMHDYGSWCTSAKGKWKIAWVEDDEEHSPTSGSDSVHSPTADPSDTGASDAEIYYTYDANNAPEFLVGTSSSLMVQATPGFHSGRHLRPRTLRRPLGRQHRPPALVLASGSQPEDRAPTGSAETAEYPTGSANISLTARSLPAPIDLKHPDLRGIELLIGPFDSGTKHKAKPTSSSATANRGHSEGQAVLTRHGLQGGTLSRHSSWHAETGPASHSLTSRPRRRHRQSALSLLRRWFRRWTR